MLFKQYIRDFRRNPFGVLLAEVDEESKTIKIGWSVCHPGDPYDKKLGEMIAKNRLDAYNGEEIIVPTSAFIDTYDFVAKVCSRAEIEPAPVVLDGYVCSSYSTDPEWCETLS